MFKKVIYWTSVIFIGVAFGLVLQIAKADWTPLPPDPPTSNVGAPVSTGAVTQLKSGALGISGILRGYSGAIFDSNVGIGKTSPAFKLDVSGDTNSTRYCINGANCISAWPSGSTNYWTLTGNYLYPNSTSYNVGIGSGATTPASKLSVGGNGSSSYGIYGLSSTSGGSGIYGIDTTAGAGSTGVSGEGAGRGVFGYSSSGQGVYGVSTTGYGVYGSSGSSSRYGVYGTNSAGGFGVYGISSGYGVYGTSSGTAAGVFGESSAGYGIYGKSTGTYGVYGTSSNTTGVYGNSTSGTGVQGNGGSYGGHFTGHGSTVAGVYGYNQTGNGVQGQGVYGGYFNGTTAGAWVSSCPTCSVIAEMVPVGETPNNGDIMCTNRETGKTEICKEDKSSYIKGIAQKFAESILRMGCKKTLDKNGENGMNLGTIDVDAWQKNPECQGWYPIALSGLSEQTNVVCESPNGNVLGYGDILVTSNVAGHLRPLDKDEDAKSYQIVGRADSICNPGKEVDSIQVWIQ